jgi:type IV secretion system protein VirB10
MADHPIDPVTVPPQPAGKPPIARTLPIVLVLTGAVLLIGASTAYNAMGNHKRDPGKSALPVRPSTANPQQINGFEKTQADITKTDAQNLEMQKTIAALRAADAGIPAAESDPSMPMTPAQSAAIYGGSPNAPSRTSGAAEARAEAKQKAAARAKQREDALNSGTVAIDFSQTEEKPAGKPIAAEPAKEIALTGPPGLAQPPKEEADAPAPPHDIRENKDPLAAYDFDAYGGKLYRVFEGTVLEGVVTNHIDGSMAGPILIMLTTDYYSHDRQQLLLPQGTRLIGEVGSVGNQQQHKLMVVFHRAVCPDGFSIDLDKYPGLDPLGTTGLATQVDHGYLMAFGAAAAVGGLGGLAQIGNSGSALTTSSQLRNGLSSQTSAEGEQILDHFLNRLPIITLKEGSRARVYINRDILIPSYAEHRVNPTL